ncbi:MAG TPA: hypothetical protein VIK53_13530 [Verrucomicrobiae bacterium]
MKPIYQVLGLISDVTGLFQDLFEKIQEISKPLPDALRSFHDVIKKFQDMKKSPPHIMKRLLHIIKSSPHRRPCPDGKSFLDTDALFLDSHQPKKFRQPWVNSICDGRLGGARASRVLVALRKEFGRRARNIVGQISLTGFRRDAENGNRDGRAPHVQRSGVSAERRKL